MLGGSSTEGVKLGLRTTPKSKPAEGGNAFGTEIGKARADGKFHCIRYGQLETEPACMICIDVTLDIGPGREMKDLRVEMAVGSEKSKARKNGKKDKSGNKKGEAEDGKAGKEGSSQKSPAGIVRPEIVDKGWGPELLHGIAKPVDYRTAYNLQSGLNFSGLAGVGFTKPSLEREMIYTEENRWELIGMRRHDDAGCDRGYRIMEWTLSGKKLTRTTMPREFRLGLIVEHGNLPFDLDFRYIGSLIAGKKRLEFGWARRQRVFHFDPPEGAVEVLRKEDLQKLLDEMNHLAVSYSNLGRMQEAMKLSEKVVEACQSKLGSEHPDTLSAMINLANNYSNLGHRQEAIELREKVSEASKHPDTLSTVGNFAHSYTSEHAPPPYTANSYDITSSSKTSFIDSDEAKPEKFKNHEVTYVSNKEENIIDNKERRVYSLDDVIPSGLSDNEEIQSKRSVRRLPLEMVAESHLAITLAKNVELAPLHEEAISKIGADRYIDNFRRLLEQYYLDLSQNAVSNPERATVDLLKSRWSRVRMVQEIVDRYGSKSEDAQAQIERRAEEVQGKMPLIEDWRSKNTGFAYEATATEIQDSTVINANEATESDTICEKGEEISGEKLSSMVFPRVSEMENFMTEGSPFQNLVTNLRVFLLPPDLQPLARTIMSVPSDRLWFSAKDDNSIFNKMKIWIESITEENWNWWPFRPKTRLLQKGETRLHWYCHCNVHLWKELSELNAEKIHLILKRRSVIAKTSHLCSFRQQNQPWKNIYNKITCAASGTFQQHNSTGSSSKSSTDSSQNASMGISGKKTHAEKPQTEHPKAASAGQQASQTSINIPQTQQLFIFFGVKGTRRTLELAQIDAVEHREDKLLFSEMKIAYRKLRGHLRYVFSVWRLSHCDFVKFEKIRANRVIFRGNEIPTDTIYEYAPRAPHAENPPISPHEFDLAFASCGNWCLFWPFHDCVEPSTGNSAIERIPKRKTMLELNTGGLEHVWGLQAQHVISFVHMLFYHCMIFVGTFGFSAWWLVKNPLDLQNAAVPMTTVAVLLSLFWGSAGVLKVFRDPI